MQSYKMFHPEEERAISSLEVYLSDEPQLEPHFMRQKFERLQKLHPHKTLNWVQGLEKLAATASMREAGFS